ncbi:3603_t:CDS:1, partial [Acaulospora morrowiae]
EKKVKCTGYSVCSKCQNDGQVCLFKKPTPRGPPRKNKINDVDKDNYDWSFSVNNNICIINHNNEEAERYFAPEKIHYTDHFFTEDYNIVFEKPPYRKNDSENVFFGVESVNDEEIHKFL